MTIDVSLLQIPPVSPDGLKALDIMQQPEPDLGELANVVLRDSILSLTLIKYANSPLYRRTIPVDNVPAAIRVLGLRNIHSAIVMATMRPIVRRNDPVSNAIWNHCIDISLLCERLTMATAHEAYADEIVFLGLVHDIGMLVLAHNFPDIYAAIIEVSARELINVDVLEEQHLGIRHDDIVAHILKDFRLPESHIALLSAYHSDFCTLAGDPQSIRRSILDMAHHIWLEANAEPPFFEQTGDGGIDDIQAFLEIDDGALAEVHREYVVERGRTP